MQKFGAEIPVPDVEFNSTLKDTKVIEGQDAVFECALSDLYPKSPDDSSAHGKSVGAGELARHLAKEKAKLQREKDKAARKAQAEKDEAARRVQSERDEAARRAQAEQDEVSRRPQAEQAARRAQSAQDEAARKAQEEQGYECYMSCAVTGNPTPHITWYHNNVSLNPNYYITYVCGVYSLLILRVGPKDMGIQACSCNNYYNFVFLQSKERTTSDNTICDHIS
ncbi:hypothetical protein cypCar_00035123 [Cyprinus carpio]|nr:hypothetical protein cypCar_00035123 [Cyprinus carpio]